PPAFADPRTAIPLYRSYSCNAKDHLYTTNADEHANAVANLGYTNEGVVCYVFSSQQPNTIPLYRLLHPVAVDHFYTTSSRERKDSILLREQDDEDIVGYVYQTADCGGLALWRLYNSTMADHLYTVSVSERDHATNHLGYTLEGNEGFVLPF
ncbi:hypothetical protein BDQ17DRAFT_1255503, partial [Cyathus striatus]